MNADEAAKHACKEIKSRCYSLDIEGNNCQLDSIIREFFIEIGQPELEKAFDDVECWKCIALGKRQPKNKEICNATTNN